MNRVTKSKQWFVCFGTTFAVVYPSIELFAIMICADDWSIIFHTSAYSLFVEFINYNVSIECDLWQQAKSHQFTEQIKNGFRLSIYHSFHRIHFFWLSIPNVCAIIKENAYGTQFGARCGKSIPFFDSSHSQLPRLNVHWVDTVSALTNWTREGERKKTTCLFSFDFWFVDRQIKRKKISMLCI